MCVPLMQVWQTVGDFFAESGEKGFMAALRDRMMWGDMRMMKADIEDVQGFTALINGIKHEDADPIVLQYGERVRFKFINENFGSATS